MEKLPEHHISELSIETNLTGIEVAATVVGPAAAAKTAAFSIKVAVEAAPGEVVAVGTTPVAGARLDVGDASDDGTATVSLVIPNPRLWSPHSPFLYNLTATLLQTATFATGEDGVHERKSTTVDEVTSCVRPTVTLSSLTPTHMINQENWLTAKT